MECRLAGETEVLGENLPQRHFCPSQNPTWPDLFWTRAAAVGSRRLTAWAMARPPIVTYYLKRIKQSSEIWICKLERERNRRKENLLTFVGEIQISKILSPDCCKSLLQAQREDEWALPFAFYQLSDASRLILESLVSIYWFIDHLSLPSLSSPSHPWGLLQHLPPPF
jgi:hypothetical protein